MTNAFLHTSGDVAVEIAAGADRVHVAVRDWASAVGRVAGSTGCAPPPAESESGRGLAIVRALGHVTVHQLPDGKIIEVVIPLGERPCAHAWPAPGPP